MTQGYMGEISAAITTDTSKAQTAFNDTLATLTKNLLNNYINKNAVSGVATIKLSDVENIVNEHMSSEEARTLLAKLEAEYLVPQDVFSTMYSGMIKEILVNYIKIQVCLWINLFRIIG